MNESKGKLMRFQTRRQVRAKVFTPKCKFGLTHPLQALGICHGVTAAGSVLVNWVKDFVFLPGGTDTSAETSTACCCLEEGLAPVWVGMCRK